MEDPIPDSAALAASLTSPAEFAPVFDRHYDAVHAYLQRRIGPDAADELAAQTFLVAFERRGRYDQSRPDARPWLFGIATNLLLHHRRQMVRRLRAYARTGVDPVLDAFRDQVLFLKHNLNAQAISALGGTTRDLQKDISRLIADMEKSIKEADAFIAAMHAAP